MGETVLTSPDFKVTFSGYHPDKYVTTPEQDTNNSSDIDLILFRSAEVYLNFAEALAEAGELTQADLDMSVNLLRRRAGVSAGIDLATANANPDPFLTNAAWGGYQSPVLLADANKGVILEIRRERAVELCQEGFRYYDLMRWKEGKLFETPFYGMYFAGTGAFDVDGNGTNDIEIYTDSNSNSAATANSMTRSSSRMATAASYGCTRPSSATGTRIRIISIPSLPTSATLPTESSLRIPAGTTV